MAAISTPPANAAMAQSHDGTASRAEHRRVGRARPNYDFMVGRRVALAGASGAYERQACDPVYRPLRIYALDPAASVRDGALSVVNVPFEPIERGPRGPRGKILEIVSDDRADPASIEPVDLDDKFLLMQQGRSQSPEDALFRQQMVYAVCTTTYAAFRQALGRDVIWGIERRGCCGDNEPSRLRIRPSVSDLENAYYDRSRGEICFGTFSAGGRVAGRNVPGGRISLSLSHDVVVHEMSHALLDGLRSHFLFPSNLDVLAFHEAFADLIAIFQRFTYRDVVLAAVRSSRGEIPFAKLLTDIAVQFAQATTATGALRSAVGGTERRYEDTIEPHHRGEVLVGAVFDAFTTVFNRKTMPLMRIATGGTGILPAGQIPDVLAAQLTERACRLASQFLTICIRAIDYCPPVDITFGEFLRAVITADIDLVPHDEFDYREAWIDAFAKRRIYPSDVPSLSESALLWRPPGKTIPDEPHLSFSMLHFDGDPGRAASPEELMRQACVLGQLAADPRYRAEFGLAGADDSALEGDKVNLPVVESIRPSRRVGPSGQVVFDLVAEITQRREVQPRNGSPGFDFFGGATVILDPRGKVRFVIRKSILDSKRLGLQRTYLEQDGLRYFAAGPGKMLLPEPKLLLQLHGVTRPQSQPGAAAREILTRTDTGKPGDAPGLFLRTGNKEPLVTLLKACLNQLVVPPPALDAAESFDIDTERAVSRLQSSTRIIVDGIVGPFTWTVIGREMRMRGLPPPPGIEIPDWVRRLLLNEPGAVRLAQLDVQRALEIYQFGYGAFASTQREGFTQLLNSLAADKDITDMRWAAYMLATVKHECGDKWRPIEEWGKGKGRKYGEPETVTDENGLAHQNAYYGRGYVQLTWKYNYETLGGDLGLGNQLVIEPERALEHDTAYRIMSFGMRNGRFTGKRLDRYINAAGVDYFNARRIINGLDQAERISAYARHMETVLLASIPVESPPAANAA
jgi:hypothetical protein